MRKKVIFRQKGNFLKIYLNKIAVKFGLCIISAFLCEKRRFSLSQSYQIVNFLYNSL